MARAVPVVDEGLGNTSWLVDLGDGRALVVDPSRDLRAVRRLAAGCGLQLAFAADTHLHADFVTGAVDLAAEGAQLLAPAAGARQYGHRGLEDGDEVDLGGLTLHALATPGHTDEHMSFLLLEGARPVGVFTGGSLIVGAAARTDLVSPDRTQELARAQWRSLQRLATLPDDVMVWPTHGAGSFCSAPAGAERSSTIGQEKAQNPLLGAGSEEAFVRALLSGLGDYPPYFRRLAEVNRRGPAPLPGGPHLDPVPAQGVADAVTRGALVVDVRPIESYAAAHVPGSLSIPLRPVFATWLGWTAAPHAALLFVRDTDQDPDEIAWAAAKIGFDSRLGELAGGLPAWRAAGLPVLSTPLVAASALDGRAVIDVRQRSEFGSGHLPGATNLELGRLAGGDTPGVPAGAALMCGHGERAMTAASLLERSGQEQVAVVVGGPEDWAAGPGRRLVAGP